MDQRYKEYLKNQGKVDSVCIWDVQQDRDRAFFIGLLPKYP